MIRWYKCNNVDCKSKGHEFTIVVDNSETKLVCPFCHNGTKLERLIAKEYKNKHMMASLSSYELQKYTANALSTVV